jgi:serine/threonine-protein phosphatase 2A regulatory subunit A
MAWLTDHGMFYGKSIYSDSLVFAIREAATETLHRLTEKFGVDWAVSMILPKVIELANDTNYLHRMTCLFCFNTLARSLGKEKIVANFFPTLKKVRSNSFSKVDF